MTLVAKSLVTVAATAAAGVITVISPTQPAHAATPIGVVRSAVASGHSHGYRTAVAVYDTKLRKFYGAGDYNSAYASESLVKLFIATRLLASGQMTGTTAGVAWQMIVKSNDFAATALYGRAGGDSVINWVKAYYGIPFLGSPPPSPGHWGATRVTARGMAYFLAKMKADRRVAPWLLHAMHNSSAYGADGQFQKFGLPAASPSAAFKSGWGMDFGDGSADFNSVGLVNSDRYAAALLVAGPGRTYGRPISDALTSIAKTLLPGGRFPDAGRNPLGHIDTIRVTGNTMTITGWAFDPDIAPWGVIRVGAFEDSRLVRLVGTYQPHLSVNRAFHLRGTHGYRMSFTVHNGTHQFCVVYVNVRGGSGTRQCLYRSADGRPVGRLDTVTVAPDKSVVLTGWAWDPDNRALAASVQVAVDGVLLGAFPTTLVRADVNLAFTLAGDHGFVITVPPLPPGDHRLCLSVANVGPPVSPDTQLGCGLVTIA